MILSLGKAKGKKVWSVRASGNTNARTQSID
jgi:hypothetical protein